MSAAIQGSKVLYTAKVRTEGDRNGGVSRSDDGRIGLTHTSPGQPGNGTNPEQLLAAGWAACFVAAMGVAAQDRKIAMPSAGAIDAEVDLVFGEQEGYSLQARFNVSVPGLPRDTVKELVDAAHRTCPYSKAMRSVPMELNVV